MVARHQPALHSASLVSRQRQGTPCLPGSQEKPSPWQPKTTSGLSWKPLEGGWLSTSTPQRWDCQVSHAPAGREGSVSPRSSTAAGGLSAELHKPSQYTGLKNSCMSPAWRAPQPHSLQLQAPSCTEGVSPCPRAAKALRGPTQDRQRPACLQPALIMQPRCSGSAHTSVGQWGQFGVGAAPSNAASLQPSSHVPMLGRLEQARDSLEPPPLWD